MSAESVLLCAPLLLHVYRARHRNVHPLPLFNIALTLQNLLSFACDQPLDVGDALGQDLLQDLGVLELFGDLCDDAIGEFFLLALLDLAFVADPGVEHGLRLRGQEGLLL